jgi:adenosylhomocysteine nucleosidase
MTLSFRLGVVTGLEFEADMIRRRAAHEGFSDRVLVAAGLGRERARQAAQSLASEGTGALLSFGIATGLGPKVDRGTAILATAIKAENLPTIACSPSWIDRLAVAIPRALRGDIAHAPAIIAARTEKAKVFGATSALAADMESYGIGEAALAANLPFAALRVVADTAAEDLPDVALHAMAPNGSLKLAEMLGRIARNPGQIPHLLRLGRAAAQARARLDALAATGTIELFFAAEK